MKIFTSFILTIVVSVLLSLTLAAPIVAVSQQAQGLSFGTTKNLSHNDGASSRPQVAASGNNVYVVWEDNTLGNAEIFFRKSTDGGHTFGSTKNLSNNVGLSARPLIVLSGANVYILWVDNTPGNFDVFFKRSTDSGKTFGSTHNLSKTPGFSDFPKIAVSGSNVYVVWDENNGIANDCSEGDNCEVFFTRSTDGGKTFGSTRNLSHNAASSYGPGIAASGDKVYVVWVDDTPALSYKRSTDGGITFGSTKTLGTDPLFFTFPEIAVSGETVHVLWENGNVLYRRSTDGGIGFAGTKNLGSGSDAQLLLSSTNVYVVMSSSSYDIIFKRSMDAGTTFGAKHNLSNDQGLSFIPRIAASGSNVYVAWQNFPNPGDPDVFFTSSSNHGATFASVKNLSNNSGFTFNADVAASVGRVYVAWDDDTLGNFEVFFKGGSWLQ